MAVLYDNKCYALFMIRFSLFVFCCFAMNLHAEENLVRLDAVTWAQPRQGEMLLQNPILSRLVSQLLALPESRLDIHYPGGDDGLRWASEVRAWLVALGISSGKIGLIAGSSAPSIIELLVNEQVVANSKLINPSLVIKERS